MDPDSSPSSVATGWTTTRAFQQSPPLTDPAHRVPASPERAVIQQPPRPEKDGKRAKTGRGPAGLGLGKTKPLISANSQTKPLLPVTERRSHEDNLAARRAKKRSQDEDKWDITPDGGSAGREGRQFAVANVGNNGRIYLRPTVRPAHQRYPQPNFVFPMTPPSTAGLEAIASDQRMGAHAQVPLREWTPSHPPSSSHSAGREASAEKQIKIRQRQRRAMSDSTIPDTSVARESEPGGFKVVITKPGEEQRPRTVDEMDSDRPPLLEVAIPSWRIGTPRFSIRGTPFFRGSSYAPTEDVRLSNTSFLRLARQDGTPSDSKRLSYFRISGFLSPSADSSNLGSIRNPPRLRTTYMSTHLVIEPSMFDVLTFKPACDDRAIVRYSASGTVTAATPPRLVAEITSPSFVDYELLSDFFLTYRSFLEPSDLLRMLFARLQWALYRTDEAGQVVRVRTFVAIRHWILNYFIDDFLWDHNLRVILSNLLNGLVDEFSQDQQARKVPLKILAELKKCWRRVCAQFWDGPEFDASLGPEAPVSPGGIAGHRDSKLDLTVSAQTSSEPPQLADLGVNSSPLGRTSFFAGLARAGHIDAVVAGERPATPENAADDDGLDRNGAISPTSITSVDVISCSFPTKTARSLTRPGARYAAAHPVDPGVMHSAEPVATTPRAVVGKRVRRQPSHKRNASLSDSLRDHPSATDGLYKNAEFLLALPYAGSLVRGNLLPPSQALVEVHPPNTNARQTTIFQPVPAAPSKEANTVASAMSGQGMKRLLGSVRRALSTKGQHLSPTQGTFLTLSPIGPRGATINRLPGTPIVPQTRGHQKGGRPPVRIDLLGAQVAEDFKKAVREDFQAQSEKSDQNSPPANAQTADVVAGSSTSHLGPSLLSLSNDHVLNRPTSDMGITTGSKSIVIVDDTSLPEGYPVMTGALPAVNSSVEAFAEAFVPSGADPTPPNTPPGRPMGTPRRSSYILGQHMLRHSHSADPLPPFIPDLDTIGVNARLSEDQARPSLEFLNQAPTPASTNGARGHTRQPSSQSYHSNRTRGLARQASFARGSFHQATVRSFDATTVSGESVDEVSPASPASPTMIPQPLRVLRRRPGGDLRAVTNVGDLDPAMVRQSNSAGSLTTYSDSIRSSYLRSAVADSSGDVDGVASNCSPGHAETFSLGAIAEQHPKRNLSLFSTHSSKPVMRPSFEAEAQKLALIPDDMDDDGGVESALLKLEGKYPIKKMAPKLSMDLSAPPKIDVAPDLGVSEDPAILEEKEERRIAQVGDELPPPSSSTAPSTITHQGGLLDVTGRHERHHAVQSFLSDDSRASYSSIPLLQRGLTDDGHSRRTDTREWTDRSILQGPDEDPATPDDRSVHDSQHPSYDFVKKTDSMDRILQGATVPTPGSLKGSLEHSFLDVDSDNESDLSSELSAEALNEEHEVGIFSPSDIGVAISTLPAHPLGESQPSVRPESQSMTLIQALQMSPEAIYIPTLQDHQVWEKPLPPTPDTTPTSTGAPFQSPISSSTDPTGTKEALRNAPTFQIPDPVAEAPSAPRNKCSVHLPFILAFDSDILAQQFTLVEKDALNEIDWKELIEMRWKNAEQNGVNVRSWVSFLRDTDARGVEVVIARFNVMVKWAISEVVLTEDIEERARCVIKLIHIAAHCRRYRNFATMAQLTIALTSNEVSRLAKTWAMVPASDRRTMRELEALMSPTRNFYNMRAEMEGGGAAVAEMGCIPFVGIYTHDLLFNAQKPSEIASSPTTAPLVNFERCRTAASVVKTLLRLLEASLLYNFQPIEGITERCLWMGALADDEIRRLSEALE
ncbi:hypothetical protein N657DRAFT_575445 [Parathielavia appendiculata]|uniref:Guanine nucleotide exchange factor LTE1 n=1 Tax=Parathielavia appendiculata TaxID=2587402 RepID=A0AAN6TXU1_9PEZI|nr:hypothetical protein N657DRAFT_575445 [Parathielavia appendiculata]